MATEAPPAPQAGTPLADSRNLLPSFLRRGVVGAVEDDDDGSGDYIPAFVDIEEPLMIERGERKTVTFQYRSGVPQATAFGITWHETEADAEALRNMIQDEPVPWFEIAPQIPYRDTGELETGSVELRAPDNMRLDFVWGSMSIYQDRPASTAID